VSQDDEEGKQIGDGALGQEAADRVLD